MLWHIFGLFVLMSHSFLALVRVMADHDSVHGDQTVGCLFVTETFFIMLCFVCLRLQFSLNKHLREGRRVLLFSIRIAKFTKRRTNRHLVMLVNVLGKLKKRFEGCVACFLNRRINCVLAVLLAYIYLLIEL